MLSDRPRLLYDYFQQLFAQVTNPPLDAIREELVTSMGSTIGPEGNLLKPVAGSCRQIKIASAILDNEQLAKLRHIDERGFRSISIPMLFDARSGGLGLARALEDLQKRTSEAVAEGYTIIILSDRGVNFNLAPIPSLLAWPAFIIIWCAKARATAPRSSSRPATRAKCITWRCSSATAPAR